MSSSAPQRCPAESITTIIAKNYVAQARVLAKSFRKLHPEAGVTVLVIDDLEGHLDLAAEPFETLTLADLNIPAARRMCFKYTVMELATAVKPFLLEHLLERGARRLLYLDPDIWVLHSLQPLFDRLEKCAVLLTPHMTSRLDDDGAEPNEFTLLRSGAYNLGFVGVQDTPEARELLEWWKHRCADFCVNRQKEGLFVDQKWMDLAPALFAGVEILREPGYNVAYWNLHERRVTLEPEPRCNGEPLRFFHFSGFDPRIPDQVSKHQNRFTMRDIGEAARLFSKYEQMLLADGFAATIPWPYSYQRFDNGVRIAPLLRDLLQRLGRDAEVFGDPFAVAGPSSFYEWLFAPAAGEDTKVPYISNLVDFMWRSWDEVRAVFPAHRGAQRHQFLRWVLEHGIELAELDPAMADRVRAQIGPLPERTREASTAWAYPDRCVLCWVGPLLKRPRMKAKARALALDLGGAKAQSRHPVLLRLARFGVRFVKPCLRHAELVQALARGAEVRLAAAGATAAVPIPVSSVPAAPSAGAGMASQAKAGERATSPVSAALPVGINHTGYFRTESGVGEAARLIAQGIRAAGIPHVLNNCDMSYELRRGDRTLSGFSKENPYRMNLIQVNADQALHVARSRGEAFFRDRYNVGFWMWELSQFPAAWRDRLELFHEIWVASRFAAAAVGRSGLRPVVRIPVPVLPRAVGSTSRRRFDWATDQFVFLFLFDFMSVFERKNPLAVVEAFRRAFRADDRALLVIKCTNAQADPDNATRLRAAAAGANIRLLENYASRAEVDGLVEACDAYVSLHRSEGYGLTMAEAMAAGKPVVATAYSGNLDFMDESNSYLVPYRLVELAQDYGPYERGAHWADPDSARAGEIMRSLYENRAAARTVGELARAHILAHLSPQATGRAIEARLDALFGAGS